MKEKEFNKIPLTRFASTIADISGTEKPKQADETRVDEILSLVKTKTGKNTVDKLLIFNPDAIGEEFFKRYETKIFSPLTERAAPAITATMALTRRISMIIRAFTVSPPFPANTPAISARLTLTGPDTKSATNKAKTRNEKTMKLKINP